MKKLILILLPSLLLLSCSSEKRQSGSGLVVTTKDVDKLLAEKYLFHYDSVMAAMSRVKHDQATKGKQLFMQGLNLYVNKKEAAASIASFRESLLYNPDVKTYNYLANAYVDIGDTLRADSALNLFFEPNMDIFYTSARIAALRRDTGLAIENLAQAFSYGFSNKKRFESDNIFDHLRNERSFIALVVSYMKDEAKLKASLFKTFLASAPDILFPFVMQKDSICNVDVEGSSINYDFAPFISGMEDSRFSRDVTNDYLMVGKFKAEGGFYGVLYKSVTVMADTLLPVDVKLAVFDSLGNLTDETLFAQFQVPSILFTGNIDEEKTISVAEYKMKWKTDPLEDGYSGNEYMGEDRVGEKKYFINSEGRLTAYSEKEKAPVARK